MKIRHLFIYSSIIAAAFLPRLVHAHAPLMVEEILRYSSGEVEIIDPEISKAYYDTLTGAPRLYRITADKPFHLYLNILTPEKSNPDGRYAAQVYTTDANTRQVIASVDGTVGDLTHFHETFANDDYLQTVEYEKDMDAGVYEIEVTGTGNVGKYVLAVGKEEKFGFAGTIDALNKIPQLKRTFFNTSPATFLFSIFGSIHFLISLALGFGIGATLPLILKRKHRASGQEVQNNNVENSLRIGLFIVGDVIVVSGVFLWSPILFIIAGILYAEASIGWSSIYHVFQKHRVKV